MSGRHVKTATLIQVLVYYDAPQLAILKSNRDIEMFALAVERPGMQYPFFACEARERDADKYFDGTADLHYVFKKAVLGKYYFFDWADLADDGVARVEPAGEREVLDERFWPEVGFFARGHTHPLARERKAPASSQKYAIDGRWGATDFSRFYNKASDIYAIFAALRMAAAGNEPERQVIRNLIRDRLWRGGGSYVGFYDDLFSHIRRRMSPLDVSAISYASPGHFTLSGDADILNEINNSIRVFEDNHAAINERYKSLNEILSRESLKTADSNTPFSSNAIEQFAHGEATQLAREMEIEPVQEILAACDNNTLVFCKLMMSIYRRANGLHEFYVEGRVQSL